MRFSIATALTLLSGCSSVPYGDGEFDGRSPSPASPDTRDVAVVFVDGQLVFDTRTKPVLVGANVVQKLAPGPHELAVRVLDANDEPLSLLALNVAPCTSYRYVGKHMAKHWEVVATGEIIIRSCKHDRVGFSPPR